MANASISSNNLDILLTSSTKTFDLLIIGSDLHRNSCLLKMTRWSHAYFEEPCNALVMRSRRV